MYNEDSHQGTKISTAQTLSTREQFWLSRSDPISTNSRFGSGLSISNVLIMEIHTEISVSPSAEPRYLGRISDRDRKKKTLLASSTSSFMASRVCIPVKHGEPAVGGGPMYSIFQKSFRDRKTFLVGVGLPLEDVQSSRRPRPWHSGVLNNAPPSHRFCGETPSCSFPAHQSCWIAHHQPFLFDQSSGKR